MTRRVVQPITVPGVYRLTNREYHAQPALSNSGAKTLMRSPAHFRYQQDHPVFKNAYDVGSGAHKYVLRDNDEMVVEIPADDYKTKAAREARDEARNAGKIPLLPQEHRKVQAMAKRIEDHPVAGQLFKPGSGEAEVSLFWEDPETGVMLRAKPDWLPHKVEGRRLIVPDYKTAENAQPDSFARSAATFGYHRQDDWYRSGIRALGIDDDPAFVFVVQEKDPPYEVVVYELEIGDPRHNWRTVAARQNREAIHLFASCQETDTWPGYTTEVVPLPMPSWYSYQNQED